MSSLRRRFSIAACALAAAAATTAAVSSQTAEHRGREILGRAAAEARVVERVPRLWLVEGTGRENLTGELQGLAADAPTWRPHEERVAADFEEQSVAWECRTPRNDESLRHRRFIYAPSRTIVVDHANQSTRVIPGGVPASDRRALMRRIPHLLLADVVSRSASDVRWVRATEVHGHAADELVVDLPGDGAREIAPATGEIAPGVHVARLSGFTVMFVEQANGIVAFEAPEPFFGTDSIPASHRDPAGKLTPQIIAHIQKTIPGKQNTHAVISHHHGDHMGGIRAFAAAGAEIVMSARDAAAARAVFAAPHTILGDNAPASPVVTAVSGRLRIGSGPNAVEVIEPG